MLDEMDNKILNALMESDMPLTSYAIARATKRPLSTIRYRLDRLEELGLVEAQHGDTVRYIPNPILLRDKEISRISKHIEIISEIADKVKPMTPDGMKALILFVISRTKFIKTEE